MQPISSVKKKKKKILKLISSDYFVWLSFASIRKSKLSGLYISRKHMECQKNENQWFWFCDTKTWLLPRFWSQTEQLNEDYPYYSAARFRRNKAAGITYECTGTAPKEAKNVAELELICFLNRRLLCLTWLLPNLNCES